MTCTARIPHLTAPYTPAVEVELEDWTPRFPVKRETA
jgi:hypothetical protein